MASNLPAQASRLGALAHRVARLVVHSSLAARGFARSSSSAPPPPPPAGAAAGGAAEVSPWRVLGLARHASETEIRGRFRELAYKLHPDLNHNNSHAQIPLPGSHARADQKEKEEAMVQPFPPGTGGGAGGDRGDGGGDRGDRGDRDRDRGDRDRGDRGDRGGTKDGVGGNEGTKEEEERRNDRIRNVGAKERRNQERRSEGT